MQEVKALLEKAEDTDCRASLLRFMTEFSRHMSPRGLDTDVRHILVLVLLVGRLDDPKPVLRCAAAQLLIGTAPFLKLLKCNIHGLIALKLLHQSPSLIGLPPQVSNGITQVRGVQFCCTHCHYPSLT